MAIVRTIECCICGERYTEKNAGEGFPGWGAIQGIILNGEANPDLCPDHLTKVANFIDKYNTTVEKS